MRKDRNKEIDLKEICNSHDCTGCGACVSVCPKNCISMDINRFGARESRINASQCIECGKCRSVCPALHQEQLDFHMARRAFFAKTYDEEIYELASSGGVATAIGLEYLHRGGVVYAAVMNAESRQVRHNRIETEEQLYASQGSKYVQSNISSEIYKNIWRDIHNGYQVVFIGTPCQSAGVKRLLGKVPDNLLLVDLICHGVPGEKVFQEYMELEVGNYKCTDIRFRKKKNMFLTFSGAGGYRLRR